MDDHPSREVGRRREVVGHARDASAVTNELGRDHSVFLRVDEERVAMRERPRVLVAGHARALVVDVGDDLASAQVDGDGRVQESNLSRWRVNALR